MAFWRTPARVANHNPFNFLNLNSRPFVATK